MKLGCVLALAGTISTYGRAIEPETPTPRTALDSYVESARGVAHWEITQSAKANGATWLLINLTSQTWRSAEEVSHPEWKHWVRMCIPENRRNNLGLLVISGGSRREKSPDPVDALGAVLAEQTGSVVLVLPNVPNQPLAVDGGEEGRYEDDLIAQSWMNAQRTGDSGWVLQLPMVQSAVAAMDAAEGVLGQRGDDALEGFVVTGASKRGWTTWLTAAVDSRVEAIMPIVFDMLNMKEAMPHQYAAYGFWAPSLHDYAVRGIPEAMIRGENDTLRSIVDPWLYRQRFTMPKFILNAAGDEYFLPDTSQFYMDGLPGLTRLRYVPNADHGLTGHPGAIASLIAFHQAVAGGAEIPELTWQVVEGELVVRASRQPVRITAWSADNPKARDFRVESIGEAWKPTAISPDEQGAYHVRMAAPDEGWRAWMVDAEFAAEGRNQRLVFSTPVWVVPDLLPFEDAVKKMSQNE
ncbi:MAG: PhoPQ-activated pathogenicity [Leptolyngbya sp. PLA3]|nr:MAG: PhoPQ-activated pathogenicity [Cyanobacteria bacterium CYA]MCE7968234.1 PhoPQ-activated pathogenicity [Leptolyngbya sp. PL-A3]